MKILIFTDTHGSESAYKELKKKAKDVDFIICCGDVTIFENDIEKIMKKLSQLGKDVFIIHGNHEEEDAVAYFCDKYESLHFLHMSVLHVEGVTLVGYGGGGFSYTDEMCEEFLKSAKEHLDKKNNILITHQPPFGTKVDEVYGEHAGSKSIKKFLKNYDYAFSGHIHETSGITQKVGKTTIMNPGPKGYILTL